MLVLLGIGKWSPLPPDPVAPTLANVEVDITDSYTNGQLVVHVQTTNAPYPAPTYSIISGNADGAFAIDASTGQITVADADLLDGTTEPQRVLSVRASNGVSPNATATVTINVEESETPAAPRQLSANLELLLKRMRRERSNCRQQGRDDEAKQIRLQIEAIEGAPDPEAKARELGLLRTAA